MMKTKILIIGLSLTLSAVVFACPNGPGRNESHKEDVFKQLNLTDDQRQKLDLVMGSRHDRMQTARKQVQEGIQLELAEFLSEEQLQILEDNRPEPRQMKRGKHRVRSH